MAPADVLAMVLAGGEGKRLAPLTLDRAKPAVPFGGNYRLIDFALSNLVNAGYRRIVVLTQYKSHSLDRHLATTWALSPLLGNYVTPVPAQMRRGPRWFAGSADAIYQNFNLLNDERPDYVIVFGADHIYRMDPRQMVEQHIESGAGVTVAALRAPIDAGRPVRRDRDGAGRPQRSRRSGRSRATRSGCPTRPTRSTPRWATTCSPRTCCAEIVTEDAEDETSKHDVGGNLIPMLVERGEAQVYDFSRQRGAGRDADATRATGATSARSTRSGRPTWT